MSKTLAHWSQRSKLFPVAYILIVFFIIPGLVLYFAE
jgi:hypothetical protein